MKYYTPEIEEFHVGFEYELIPSVGYTIFNFGVSDENFETTWATKYSKGTYGVKDVSPFGGALASIRAGIKDKKCRVKYLDRKDIEDLGFKLWQIPGDSFDWEFNIDFDDVTTGTVTFNDDNTVDELEIFGTIFKIKNKSELKKLLRQLNI